MMRTFASSLLRWLSARACGSRQLHFRLREAEFSSALQSACKLFEWTLGDSRATDGASIDALRPSNNWVNLKDQHELLLIRETPAPFARRVPTPGQWPFSLSTGRNQSSEENILAASRSIFGNGNAKKPATTARNGAQPSRSPRKPEAVEVTSPRLYVGNLSFDATESDLFELFNGVGHVQNAEVVSYRHNQRSKGFAFVQMQTIEEAKRAVQELHDKEFLGRRLVVSGAKSSEHQVRS